MNSRIKLSNAIKSYLLWPVLLTILLLGMNLSIYVIHRKAGYIMSAFVCIYFIIVLSVYIVQRNRIGSEIIKYAMGYGQVQKRLLKELSLPYGVIDTDGKLMWGNDEFMDIIHQKKLAGKAVSSIFPEITPEVLPKKEKDEIIHISYDNRYYAVKFRKMIAPEFDDDTDVSYYAEENVWDNSNALIAMYLYDETEIKGLQLENKEQKLITGLLYIDNYEEALDSIDEVRRSLLTALVDRKITKYMQSIDAIIKKLEKDKYLFVFQQKYLPTLQTSRFSVLEEVRAVNIGNDMSVTVSIGLGVNADTYISSYEYARAAIDLALGRGGDQAVVKDQDRISYYGGKSVQVEKNTRVKARVKAHAFREFVEAKDKIIIMGHKIGDVDSFGAAIGVYRIAKTFNKKVHIVINEVTSSLRPMMNRFVGTADYEEDLFIKNDQAREIADINTLLVIVDVNRPSLLECEELLDRTKTIVIFDHHRQTNEAIDNAVLNYIEPYASSTSEMIAEILQYIGGNLKLKPAEADALYAGIMVDTNNFLSKAGVRTFEAAAFLRRCGADVTRIRKAFRTDINDMRTKANAVRSTELYAKYYAIAICDNMDAESPTILGAQVSNELLTISDVKASFVITEFHGKIYISARSIDEVNVQVIMEKLGGGGHLSMAGCQLENCSTNDAVNMVKKTLDMMISQGDLE